jgi:pimeloyl-ACP methyl ester carboxylesterase
MLMKGQGAAETILCLHGEPTWGYLYRNMIGPLSENFRVVVPDHMGFGKSETPQDRVYTLQTHVENLERFVEGPRLKRHYDCLPGLGRSNGRRFHSTKPQSSEPIIYG